MRRFHGEYRWFLIYAGPVRDEHGNVVRWYGTSTDIEELKRAEKGFVTSLTKFHSSSIAQRPDEVSISGPWLIQERHCRLEDAMSDVRV